MIQKSHKWERNRQAFPTQQVQNGVHIPQKFWDAALILVASQETVYIVSIIHIYSSIHCFHYTHLSRTESSNSWTAATFLCKLWRLRSTRKNVFENWLYIVWLRMTLIFNLHTANQTLDVTVYVTVQFLALRDNAYGHFPRNQWWSVTEANPISGVCLMVKSTRLTTPLPPMPL